MPTNSFLGDSFWMLTLPLINAPSSMEMRWVTRKRGNPNWWRPITPLLALPTEFEMRVRQLQLTAETYTPRVSSAPGVSKIGIGSMSPNGYLKSGA